jgi:hypothetical protein
MWDISSLIILLARPICDFLYGGPLRSSTLSRVLKAD